MVELNVHIGQRLNNVKCCGKNPIVTEYHETYNQFLIRYICDNCKSEGQFMMFVPKVVREKQYNTFRKLEEEENAKTKPL
jgi:hypothetical protein